MANNKEVRKQISSIKSTRKITSALEMVAASKIKKTQDLMFGGRPYSEKVKEVIEHLDKTDVEQTSGISEIKSSKKIKWNDLLNNNRALAIKEKLKNMRN